MNLLKALLLLSYLSASMAMASTHSTDQSVSPLTMSANVTSPLPNNEVTMEQKQTPLKDWTNYFKATENDPPKKTTVAAIDYFKTNNLHPRVAIDLGCGSGPETGLLLTQAEHVHAIDQSENGLARLKIRLTPEQAKHTTIQAASFEQAVFPQDVDWVNASFSLPFCHPDHFNEFWAKLVTSLKPGGILSGQLFGDRDTWKSESHITTLPLERAQALLAPFDLILFEEVERDGKTATGTPKHWHVFHFVARKK